MLQEKVIVSGLMNESVLKRNWISSLQFCPLFAHGT